LNKTVYLYKEFQETWRPIIHVRAAAATTSPVVSAIQSSPTHSSSSSSGLSHSGVIALATVLPIVGVIAIVAAVAFFMSRKNSNGGVEGNDVWWRRPFGGSSQTAAPATV